MSPPAKILALAVCRGKGLDSGATRTRPNSSSSTPQRVSQAGGLGRKPKAMSTRSAATVTWLPATTTGRRRPPWSGSPSSVLTSSTPSQCSSPRMPTGWRLNRKSTPSSRALATSRREPGMFASSRR